MGYSYDSTGIILLVFLIKPVCNPISLIATATSYQLAIPLLEKWFNLGNILFFEYINH